MGERDGSEDEDRLLRARLEELSSALDEQRKGSRVRSNARGGGDSNGKSGSEMGLGLRVASEFASAIVVGGLIGWLLDRLLGTKPAFLVVFFMLGVAAAVWNVIRVTSPPSRSGSATGGREAPPASGQGAPSGAREDEDEE